MAAPGGMPLLITSNRKVKPAAKVTWLQQTMTYLLVAAVAALVLSALAVLLKTHSYNTTQLHAGAGAAGQKGGPAGGTATDTGVAVAAGASTKAKSGGAAKSGSKAPVPKYTGALLPCGSHVWHVGAGVEACSWVEACTRGGGLLRPQQLCNGHVRASSSSRGLRTADEQHCTTVCAPSLNHCCCIDSAALSVAPPTWGCGTGVCRAGPVHHFSTSNTSHALTTVLHFTLHPHLPPPPPRGAFKLLAELSDADLAKLRKAAEVVAPEVIANGPPGGAFDPAYKTPCWKDAKEGGKLRCIPYFYVTGQFHSGGGSLWAKLKEHPQVITVSRWRAGAVAVRLLLAGGLHGRGGRFGGEMSLHGGLWLVTGGRGGGRAVARVLFVVADGWVG